MAHVTRAAWSAGLPTASGTFAFMSFTIRIMARAVFWVGLVSPTKSFMGSPAPLKT
jgi:hypothetical protein